MHRFLCVITLSFMLACSSEKPSAVSGQKPPEAGSSAISETPRTELSAESPYSIEIKPVPPDATRKSTIYLTAQGFGTADANIEWLVNGAPVAVRAESRFKASEIKKGDKVQAVAMIRGREVLSNIVEIRNSAPVLTKVRFVREGLKAGETLGVESEANDLDGDDVTINYEWTKNGEPAGNDKMLKVPVKRGDKLTVRITPFDGEAYGRSSVSEQDITNASPTVIEHKTTGFDGRVYTYQVKASDPDGDTLTYSLKSGPSGMTIESSAGLVKWDVPEGFIGKESFTVSVSDGQGGEVSQKLSLEIKPGQKY